jgi:EF hand
MSTRTNIVLVAVVIAVLAAAWAMPGPAIAQTKPATQKPPRDRLALAELEVKQLLHLIDTDKNGKISKPEWMASMEAAFNRLDTDHSGELDVKECPQYGHPKPRPPQPQPPPQP